MGQPQTAQTARFAGLGKQGVVYDPPVLRPDQGHLDAPAGFHGQPQTTGMGLGIAPEEDRCHLVGWAGRRALGGCAKPGRDPMEQAGRELSPTTGQKRRAGPAHHVIALALVDGHGKAIDGQDWLYVSGQVQAARHPAGLPAHRQVVDLPAVFLDQGKVQGQAPPANPGQGQVTLHVNGHLGRPGGSRSL